MLQGRYGGNLDCRELRAGATIVLPVAHDGGGLYFGDCKALMGDGEIVGPPEVGALVTASAEPRERPASLEWPRIETDEQPDDARLRQAAGVERAPGFPRAPELGGRGLRPVSAEGGTAARDGRGRAYRPDQQHGLHGVLHDAARRAPTVRARLTPATARARAQPRRTTRSTTPSRTPSSPSCMFTQPHAWFGMTCKRSPSSGRSSIPDTST